MSITAQFKALSTTKKIFAGLFIITMVGMPFQAYFDAEQKAADAAAFESMTPEQQKLQVKHQMCLVKQDLCEKIREDELRMYNTLQKAQASR